MVTWWLVLQKVAAASLLYAPRLLVPGAEGASSAQGCSETLRQSELWGHLLGVFYSEQNKQTKAL